MGDIVLAGSTSGTTTLTPTAVSGTTTITLPATSGTLLQSGTAVTAAQGGTGLTSVGTSGNLLTSNGTAWTSTAPAGGMTLLGTLTTTSGTSQTLSGLTLTNYKFLQLSGNNVGFSSADTLQSLRLAGVDICRGALTNALAFYGTLLLDLSIGSFYSMGNTVVNTINGSTSPSNMGGSIGNLSSITTSTTSISFTWTAGQAFATGTIKVYGVS